MELECYSEISQTKKGKYCIISYMWNLKKTETENIWVVARGWTVRGKCRGVDEMVQNYSYKMHKF